MKNGILPRQAINDLIGTAIISGEKKITPRQVQPASLDLRLGNKAIRLRASFLPGTGRRVSDCLDMVRMHEFDLSGGAVLETGCVYLVPLQEKLNLPKTLAAAANPKSSTGRLDVFTRVICDGATSFDHIPEGYQGPLYLEIAPRTFSILTAPGECLAQLRFRAGKLDQKDVQTVSIDLSAHSSDGLIGYRARRHCSIVNLAKIGGHKATDYWEPIFAPNGMLILDPNEFYILASKESVAIPADMAAEMAPIATEIGEFRAHYAGFFDPGFGMEVAGGGGARAVLEVRGRDVPFLLRDGQPVARLVFESMQAAPDRLYGQNGSHYQAQGLKLSKHFMV